MLTPNKHSHPDQTVVAVATAALRELKAQRAVSYQELRSAVSRSSTAGEFLFAPAVSLLYLLDLVRYLPKIDSFEYKGNG